MKTTNVPLSASVSLILLTATFVGFVTSLEAIVRRHDVLDQMYIDFGAEFPSVAKLERSSGGIEGSGVLIDSRWILTAAHLNPTQAEVNGTLYLFEDFIKHPDWTGNTGDGNDIALARLSTAVPDVTPVDWYTGTSEVGMVGVSVGFGFSGTGLTGEQAGTGGTRRASESLIARAGGPSPVTPPASVFEYDFLPPGDLNVQPREGMAVFYDSGGPVFLNVGSSETPDYVVAGIHSYVGDVDQQGRGTYGDQVGSTRVAQNDEWITETIPEPSTWAVFTGLGALALAVGFRRRLKG